MLAAHVFFKQIAKHFSSSPVCNTVDAWWNKAEMLEDLRETAEHSLCQKSLLGVAAAVKHKNMLWAKSLYSKILLIHSTGIRIKLF